MKKIFFVTQALIMTLLIILPIGPSLRRQDDEIFSDWTVEGLTRSTDTVSYTRREEFSKILIDNNGSFPQYIIRIDKPYLCGPSAGANLIGYYNGIYPELIPGFKSFTYNSSGGKSYGANREYIDPLSSNLFELMKTNQTGAGTTTTNFKNGIKTYAASKNLKVNYESSFVFLNLIFSVEDYKSFIRQGKPVVVTAKNLSYIRDTSFAGATKNNTDTFAVQNVSANHAMVGYGYVGYRYYRNQSVSVWSPVWYNPFRFVTVTQEVNFRTDEYLLVSFGDGTSGYLSLNRSTITDAFTAHIYK